MTIVQRKICAAEKGFCIRGKEYIKWPASASRNRLHGIHVNMIEVGAFFPVDLDVDKMLIHQACHSFVLKTFPFHHMAPMTGRITNAH